MIPAAAPTAFTDPWMYFCVVLAGLLVGGVRALVKGDLRTGREVDQNNARMEYLELALRTRDEQVDAALHVLPEVNDVLQKFHAVGARSRTGDQP